MVESLEVRANPAAQDKDKVNANAIDAEDVERLPCRFCANDAPLLEPLNAGLLVRYVTPFGTTKSRRFTMLCATHQRKLNRVLKRARHMGVLSSKHSNFEITSPFDDLYIHRLDSGEWSTSREPQPDNDAFDVASSVARDARVGAKPDDVLAHADGATPPLGSTH